ncbi:MAG: hypothetical protein RLZZ214_4157, partial [Verrucomicrobiota bacterium]
MSAVRVLVVYTVLLRATCAVVSAAAPGAVQFNRDIRPILSENCFYCHGQDSKHREADLRLDLPEEATRANDGVVAVVPGKPEASEMILRLLSKEKDEMMPPPKANKHVKPEQVALLKRWIAEGAKFEKHWSFIPPVRAALPEVKTAGWVRTELDRFVLGRLERESLAPAAEASPSAWLRRASFDLTGLAPSPVELDTFAAEVAGKGESAYAAAADRLLALPRYGERLAQDWLDAARYADTQGFNNDTGRSMWRWRDWVIDAFNSNKPYDEFLTEQLAGDLLPQPTLEQRIATGYGRNHVINSEGGIIDEEYRTEYVVDRVRTLGMSTLAMTLECCRCHDHKFDPFTQKNYYEFFAFFNQVPEHGEDGRVANASPFIDAPTREQLEKSAVLDSGISAKTTALGALLQGDAARRDATQLVDRLKDYLATPAAAAPGEAKLVLGVRPADGKTEIVNLADPEAKPFGTVAVSAPADVGLGPVLGIDSTAAVELDGKIVNFDKPWTFATWVNWKGGEAALCSTMRMRISPTATDFGKGMAVRLTDDGRVEVRFSFRWPAYAAQVFTREKVAAGTWQHIAVSSDGSGNAAGLRVFIDGIECAREVRHDGMMTAAKGFSAGNGKLLIGEEAAPEPRRFRGELAGLRLYPLDVKPAAIRTWVDDVFLRMEGANNRPERLREILLRHDGGEYARLWEEREQLREQR